MTFLLNVFDAAAESFGHIRRSLELYGIIYCLFGNYLKIFLVQ